MAFADEPEPLAEDTGVNQKDWITSTTFFELNPDIIYREVLPTFRLLVHVNQPPG